MSAGTTLTKPIDKFVQEILIKETCIDLNSENLAKSFSNFFNIKAPLSRVDIINLCIEIGISKLTSIELPPELRGFNHRFGDSIEICYKKGDWPGGFRHTVLHEIYELICDSYNFISPLRKIKKLERNANEFSAAVLMPYSDFLTHSIEQDFNICHIRDKYLQAYFSILLRLKTILYYGEKIQYNGFIAQVKNPILLNEKGTFEKYTQKFEIIHITFAKDKLSLTEGPLFDHLIAVLRQYYDGNLLQDQWLPHRGYILRSDIIPDENNFKFLIQMFDPKAYKNLKKTTTPL